MYGPEARLETWNLSHQFKLAAEATTREKVGGEKSLDSVLLHEISFPPQLVPKRNFWSDHAFAFQTHYLTVSAGIFGFCLRPSTQVK